MRLVKRATESMSGAVREEEKVTGESGDGDTTPRGKIIRRSIDHSRQFSGEVDQFNAVLQEVESAQIGIYRERLPFDKQSHSNEVQQ